MNCLNCLSPLLDKWGFCKHTVMYCRRLTVCLISIYLVFMLFYIISYLHDSSSARALCLPTMSTSRLAPPQPGATPILACDWSQFRMKASDWSTVICHLDPGYPGLWCDQSPVSGSGQLCPAPHRQTLQSENWEQFFQNTSEPHLEEASWHQR